MSRANKIRAIVAVSLLTVLAGSALAFSDVFFTSGTIASYDFGAYGPGYPVPGTVVVEGFTMKPGDSVGWHYHKGLSYVIVVRGTVSEQDEVAPNQCSAQQDTPGSAFVEAPGRVHNVTNNGPGSALIFWATIFPQSDGLASDGTVNVDAPSCN